jgi:enoyl-CoA hydratase
MAAQSANNRLNKLVGQLLPNSTASTDSFRWVKTEVRGRVAIITLNRPEALNSLSDALVSDIIAAIQYFHQPELNIGCIILTGAGKAFAAGADIKEMVNRNYFSMSSNDKIKPWDNIAKSTIPLIAMVNGFALGGGCEIAMMCDIMIASSAAKFGQPEIKIGTIPGAGGTQRLTRAIGKSKAMEMCLTGNMMSAEEAERAGLVSRVFPPETLLENTLKIANAIAANSLPIVKLCKEAVNSAFETTLNTGIQVERRLFHSTFALQDKNIGMNAFVDKKKPEWTHQ